MGKNPPSPTPISRLQSVPIRFQSAGTAFFILHPHIAGYPDTSIAEKLNTTPGNPTSKNPCQSVKIRGQNLPLQSQYSSIRANPILISGNRALHPHIARYPDTSIAKKLNTTPGNPPSKNPCQSVKIRGQKNLPLQSLGLPAHRPPPTAYVPQSSHPCQSVFNQREPRSSSSYSRIPRHLNSRKAQHNPR